MHHPPTAARGASASVCRRPLIVAAVVAGSAVVAYRRLLRERCLAYGATAAEASATLPGDDLLAAPDVVTTRAIGIAAPPSAIWPWLVQMGSGRGGVYTYDWIENLFGLEMRSADVIRPELQGLAEGDVLPLGSRDMALRVEALVPERHLVLRSEDGAWVWAFVLVPDGAGTRLLSRNRISAPGGRVGKALYGLVMEPGSLVMERRMLLGIRERAERLGRAA